MPDGRENPITPKQEHSRHEPASSIDLPRDDEGSSEVREAGGEYGTAAGSPVQKRKGGRKPLYQTTEEKKQRNRRAQAAFRERRTEHIKQLEADKKHLEDRVESMEAGQRKDKDENLMLKYKNSLLERILIEHDIDFRKEIELEGLSYSPLQIPSAGPQMPTHRNVFHRPRPKLPHVDTRSPEIRPDTTASASVTSASPIVPSAAHFTYRSPVQMPLSAGHSFASGQSSLIGNTARQTNSLPTVPNPGLTQRRTSMHGTWQAGFEGVLSQQPTSFDLEGDHYAAQSSPPLLQQQYTDHTGGSQFGMISSGRFPVPAGNMGQALEACSAAPPMGPLPGTQQPNLEQPYGMMGGSMSTYAPMPDSDPFGIDRSMQYPTQFDSTTGQRKR